MKHLVSPEIEAYAQAYSRPESTVCRALREETQRTMEYAQMVVGPLEGAFLQMMTQLVGAKRVREIGMFTGYSALCFADALPVNGTVVTCEINEESAAVARRYISQAPFGSKISIRMGPALDVGEGRVVGSDHAGPSAALDRHVADRHAPFHRQRTDRRAPVLDHVADAAAIP